MNRPKLHVTTVLLTRRARALKRHVAEAVKGNGTGVHQARVASRRLREAVPVLAASVKGSKQENARRKIRRLTRALGQVRELDVTLAILDDMAQRETFPRAALEEVRGRVVSGREEGRELMLKRLEKIKLEKLERRLELVADALDTERAEAWREVLSRRLLKRSKRMAAAIDDAGRMYAPERLHALRIAVKKLRYSMELAAESGYRDANRLVTTLKRGQEVLGRLHDLQVLQTHVAAVQAATGRTAAGRGLDIISSALERECRHLHGRYVGLIPQLQDVCASARDVIVPQLARALPSRRPALKMGLPRRPADQARSAVRARR